MAVGTQGSIKGVLPDHVKETGTQLVLANTYHLMLRPGEKTVAELGGLHRFMGWDGPILTDSGGLQVFSLADLNEITDAGVKFKSHVDGSEVFLDARRSMQVQNDLGSDIMMAFDQCPPAAAAPEAHRRAVDRTLRWAAQCLAAHARPAEQGLFGIVQGGVDLNLRHQCARELAAMGFDGYAIGGLAVGEGFDAMKTVLREIAPRPAAGKTPLSHGRGLSARHRGGRGGGNRHVRLRPTNPKRTKRLRIHAQMVRFGCETAVISVIRPRSSKVATATPALDFTRAHPPLFFSPARCLAPSWFPCIICGSTNG